MIGLSQLRPLRSKRAMLIVGAVVVILLASVGAYVFWSKQVWAEYTPAYTEKHKDIRTDVQKAITLPVTNIKEQDVVLAQLKDVSNRIADEQKSLCTVGVWIEWQQQFISSYKDAQIACQKKTTHLVAFQKQLDLVVIFIENDQALANIFGTVMPSNELADSSWAEQDAVWDRAIVATTKLSVSDAYKPTRQLALDKMTTVRQAWGHINEGHQQKDKAKYLAAQTELSTAIDALSEMPIQSQRSFAELTRDLEKASQKLFVQ